ncbi:MAG: prepilin-type N-terminal cleavage/methylation domain-containing protein [Desulfobacteraceae bacterium]|jgi:general secretion pathway protein J
MRIIDNNKKYFQGFISLEDGAVENSNPDETKSNWYISPSGFTMIEVLIAIFIFSIVISTIFGSFRAVFFNTDRLSKTLKLHEMASNSLAQISQDLQSFHTEQNPFYKKPDIDDEPNAFRIVGDRSDVGLDDESRLRFTSLNHLSFRGDKRQGVSEIIYYLYPGQGDEVVLKRADHLYPYPEEFEPSDKDPILCEKVKAFELIYYNQEGEEEEEWNSEDDSYKYATPRKIKIRLEVGDENFSVTLGTIVTLPIFRKEREGL